MEKKTVGLEKELEVVANNTVGLEKELEVVANNTVGLEKELEVVANNTVGLEKELEVVTNKKIVSLKEQLNIEQSKKASVILIIFSCFFAFYISKSYQMTASRTIQFIVYTLGIEGTLLLYLNVYRERILNKPHAWWVIDCGFLASYYMMLQPNAVNYSLWMIGVMCIASIVDFYFGIIVTHALICLSILTNIVSTETAMLQVVVATTIFICLRFLNKTSDLIYSCIILISITLTFLIIQEDFVLHSLKNVHTVYFIGTSIMVAIIGFLIKLYMGKNEGVQGQDDSITSRTGKFICNRKLNNLQTMQQSSVILEEVLATTEESFISKEYIPEIIGESKANGISDKSREYIPVIDESKENGILDKSRANILGITDETHPLLIRLRNEAPKLYKHSMESAKLSKEAASIIGANKELAYAGSLYHEIGRLEGNDYISLGLYLLDLYCIPQEVKEVVKQHSYKSDLPKTREAAVVLLTDNILTTMEYLREIEKKNVTYDKIIEDIIFLRLNNKTLDDSGLSIQDFNRLREFYVSQFRGQV